MVKSLSQKKYITFLLLLFIFALRIPFISNSPFETGESWRQGDTESIARNFVNDRFHILFPQMNYDGPAPNYAQLEFQLLTYLIAILYEIFGFHYELARIVPILFFVGSSYFLFLFTQKYYSTETAWITMLIYSLFPLNIYFSRAIMPESAVLFFYIGAFYFFTEWIDKEQNWLIITAACMTGLAILIKIPAIFVGIPMFVMCVMKFKRRIFVTWQLWAFACISLLPPYIYFRWLGTVAEFTFVTGIRTKHIIPEFTTAIFSSESIQFFINQLPQAFTLIGLFLFIIGLGMINWGKEYPIGIWMLAITLEVITIVAVIQFNYYLILAGPIIAIIIGKALSTLLKWRYKIGIILSVVILVLIGIISLSHVEEKYAEKTTLLTQAKVVKQYTEEDDLIVVSTIGPELLNASDRKGWRANIDYYEYIPKDPKQEIDYYIRNGAKYFFPVNGHIYGDHPNAYRKYLEQNFTKIEVNVDGGDYSFYKLQ